MKPVDVKLSIYIDFSKENNKEGPKFKIGDHVRISKYKTFLQKPIFQIDLKKFLWIKKLKALCCWHMLLVILREIVGMFYEKELQKTNEKEFRVEKVDFAKKTDLANLKSGVDKLDIDKLKNVPSNLSYLKNKVGKLDIDKLLPVT